MGPSTRSCRTRLSVHDEMRERERIFAIDERVGCGVMERIFLSLFLLSLLSHWVQWFTHGTRDVTTWKGNIERDQNGFLCKRGEGKKDTLEPFLVLFLVEIVSFLFPYNIFLSYSLFLLRSSFELIQPDVH